MAKKKKRVHGRVQATTCNGSLRLQFPTKVGKTLKAQGINFPRYRSLGKPETDPVTGKSNRPWAEAIAARIQADLDHPDGLFDYTLEKYLSIKVADENGEPTLLTSAATMTIGKLWDDFLEYHTADKAESTTYKYKIDCARKITPYRDLPINLDTANFIRSDFLKQQNGITKTILSLLENGVDWAISQDRITLLKNPFRGLSKSIKVSSRKNKLTGLPDDFVAYTEVEVKTILDAFLGDNSRSKYYPFFRFKFMTGCRTGEAIALTWDDVKFDSGVILFDKTCSVKTGVTKGTKTQDCRTFPMSDELSAWLRTLKESSSSRLVFPGNSSDCLSRQTVDAAWGGKPKSKRVGRPGTVIALAKEGKIAQYLSMYNTRHTFINACLERGVDTITIADWCGNSDRIIEKAYRSRKRNIDINKQMPSY